MVLFSPKILQESPTWITDWLKVDWFVDVGFDFVVSFWGILIKSDGLVVITTEPLSQMSFLPDLMQVYFLPETIAVAPNLLQTAPVFTEAYEMLLKSKVVVTINSNALNFIE